MYKTPYLKKTHHGITITLLAILSCSMAWANADNGFTLEQGDLVVEDGNVGIGTTDPKGGLHISSGSATLVLDDPVYQGHNDMKWLLDQYSHDGALRIHRTNDAGTFVPEDLVIDENGNIGIGTINPSEKLDVQGNIKASDTICDKNGCIGNLDAINAARSICYSALTGDTNRSIIMLPLPNNLADLDAVCHSQVNSGWHAGGVAKANYYHQDCGADLSNKHFGGGYTSYVTESYFESNRNNFPNCNSTNAFICCSTQFPND